MGGHDKVLLTWLCCKSPREYLGSMNHISISISISIRQISRMDKQGSDPLTICSLKPQCLGYLCLYRRNVGRKTALTVAMWYSWHYLKSYLGTWIWVTWPRLGPGWWGYLMAGGKVKVLSQVHSWDTYVNMLYLLINSNQRGPWCCNKLHSVKGGEHVSYTNLLLEIDSLLHRGNHTLNIALEDILCLTLIIYFKMFVASGTSLTESLVSSEHKVLWH